MAEIQARAFRDVNEYILPIRLDDTEIPGLAETIGYIDSRQHSLEDIASLLEQKLAKAKGTNTASPLPDDLRSISQKSAAIPGVSTSTQKSQKAVGQKRSVTIIAAQIGLIGAIILAIATIAVPIIGRWLNNPSQEIEYVGRVIDSTDLSPITGAKITLNLAEVPLIVYTDSEGVYKFKVAIQSNVTSQIRVDAQGYETYIRNIELSPDIQTIEDIRLLAEVPLATPTVPTAISQFDFVNSCDEKNKIADVPNGVRFRRWQGVSLFAVENAPEHTILSNMVRAMTIDQRGLWLGYFPMPGSSSAGLGFYEKANWYNCNFPDGVNGENVNDIAVDHQGRIWVTLEGVGVALYDGEKWTRFTRSDGLASKDVFRITIDSNNVVWVGTWEGVAKYDGKNWSIPYSAENGTLQNNHIAAILFEPQGNIWLGHLERGISLYKNSEGKWEFIEASEGSLGGNKVRALALQAADANGPESVWVATADGGLSRYSNGIWTQYHVQDGLPSEDIKDVKIDPLNRVWVATAGGVVYLENGRWIVYDTYDTARIAFGVACKDTTCPYDQDHILTATSGSGFTHSRLPKPNMLDVPEVCFVIDNQDRTCVSPTLAEAPNTIEAALPTPVLPGQKIRFEIIVSPRSPYQLREDRGDLLSFAEESDANLFGAFTQIAVKGTVDSGQKYTFTDYDNPIVVPQIDNAKQEFKSAWRVWLFTRYAGPKIVLVFTAQK